MRICVFGAGSLGSALGGLLAVRNNVVLIGRKPHISAVRKNGLMISGDTARTVIVDGQETANDLVPPELLIIATKAYDTAEAIQSCRRLVDNDTMVLTLQNGLGNLELLRNWRRENAFGGTTTLGATLVSPGVLRVSGLGKTVIGADIDPEGAGRIVSEFKSCGLPTRAVKHVFPAIWGKAVVNACINPTAAILRVPNGRLVESKAISRFMREVCVECELVAKASGINLSGVPMYSRVRSVCKDTAENVSSMLQDVRLGRRTEIDHINGAFSLHGDKSDIPTPLNDALVAIVHSICQYSQSEKG